MVNTSEILFHYLQLLQHAEANIALHNFWMEVFYLIHLEDTWNLFVCVSLKLELEWRKREHL